MAHEWRPGRHQAVFQPAPSGYPDSAVVEIGAAALFGKEEIVLDGIQDDPGDDVAVLFQGDGNGPVRQAMKARWTAIGVLASVRTELGSLDKVVRLVKVLGMVNATEDFKQQSQVINGFSDLMVEVFGKEAGTAARSAVGMGSLPIGIAVEIEAVFEVRD